VAFPNGTTTEYGYDFLSRLTSVRLKRGTTLLHDITYEWDDLDRRTGRTENAWRQDYGYNELSRLISVQSATGDGPTVLTEQYTHDEAGNRLTALGVPGPWSYGDRNELLSYDGITFVYDDNGNLFSRSKSPARTYAWDVENRLLGASEHGDPVATFGYDPLGRRVTKTVAGVQTRFVYDGEDVLREQNPSGTTTYVHGPGRDEPLAKELGVQRTFFHADGLGSIVRRTNQAGVVLSSSTYDSFGRSTGLANGYSFTGREWHAEAGLYSYRARAYDPVLGRFLSVAPSAPAGGVNPYAYACNDPVNMNDPFGTGGEVCTPSPDGNVPHR